MTPCEALIQATEQTRAFKYQWDKLRAIRSLGGWDIFPYQTPEETVRERQGICRDLAIYALDTAYRLAPGEYYLVIGDTDDPDDVPDHAWCEARDGDGRWWSDPTNRETVDRPEWFSSFTPCRLYRFALNEQGRAVFTARLDVRKVSRG